MLIVLIGVWSFFIPISIRFYCNCIVITGDTLNLQTIDESQDPLSVSNKDFVESSVKFKQRKNTKPLKEQKESMKRIKQPENWKVNLKKNARLKGEEYIGVGGKYRDDKQIGLIDKKLIIRVFQAK